MFNIVQMPEVNSDVFRIIKGQVSPAGYPIGAYDVIAEGVAYDPARQLMMALERAHHVGAVALVVLPCFEDDETGEMIPQLFGPDISTEFWCLFLRNPDGTTEVIDDYATATEADADGAVLAKGLGIVIEAAPWDTDGAEPLHQAFG
jgi:hypothetical protein